MSDNLSATTPILAQDAYDSYDSYSNEPQITYSSEPTAAQTAAAIENGFANLVAGSACGLSMFGLLGLIIAVIALIRTFKLKAEIVELRSKMK